jgi:hypothetical protein
MAPVADRTVPRLPSRSYRLDGVPGNEKVMGIPPNTSMERMGSRNVSKYAGMVGMGGIERADLTPSTPDVASFRLGRRRNVAPRRPDVSKVTTPWTRSVYNPTLTPSGYKQMPY